jgi:hypothetical protein
LSVLSDYRTAFTSYNVTEFRAVRLTLRFTLEEDVLQGNPFETEHVVKENVSRVHQGVVHGLPSPKLHLFGRIRKWWKKVASVMPTREAGARRLEPIEDRR